MSKRHVLKEELRTWTLESPLYPHMSVEVENVSPLPRVIIRANGLALELGTDELNELNRYLLRRAIGLIKQLRPKYRFRRRVRIRYSTRLDEPTVETLNPLRYQLRPSEPDEEI